MKRMSPTPLDRSVSPMRSVSTAPDTPAELTTIEKLQARVWLMEEELAFATKIQTRSEAEAREWNQKLLGLRRKLEQAMAGHREASDAKAALSEPPTLSAQEQEQQQLLEKLKRHIAELGEKRQETLEELEAVKEAIERNKSANELERGSRADLVAEKEDLLAKITQVSEAREQQQELFDEYESSREQMLQGEVARIEQHVMGKLEAITQRRQRQEDQISQAKEEIDKVDLEVLGKQNICDTLKAQLEAMQAELKKKSTKKDDFLHSTQSMLDNIQKTQQERTEAVPKLEQIYQDAPMIEAKLQKQVAKARREGILCLEEKALLLEALGQDSMVAQVRDKIERMKLKLDFNPAFIALKRGDPVQTRY